MSFRGTTCPLWWKKSQNNKTMKIFLQSFFQIGLVAINTMLISKGILIGVFIVSFLISLLWAFNVSKVAISTIKQKIIYALGAGCGAVIGLILITLIFKK